MRITLNLDDELVRQAQEYAGIREMTALIHEALRRLITTEAARRLALLGGAMPDFEVPPRRRSTVRLPAAIFYP
jgi:Arc/MetJ family transcription regulator